MRPKTLPWLDDRPVYLLVLVALAALLLLFQLGSALVEFGRQGAAALAFPYPLDYGEGPLLDQALRLARGEAIYDRDLASPPYTVTHNPPLYPLLQAPLMGWLGVGFGAGRAVSLISALAAAVLLGLTLHTLSGDWLASAAGGLALLAMPYVLHGSALNHPGLLALALSWAGLFLTVRWPERRWAPWLGGLCFALAIFTRQTYWLAAPLAGLAWLLGTRRLRQAAWLAGVTVGLSLAGLVLMQLLTGGGFLFNLVTANPGVYSFKQVVDYMVRLLPKVYFLLFGALIFLAAERTGDHTRTWPFVLPYFAGAALSTLIFAGRTGAGVTDLYEACAAFALAGGAFLAWAGRNTWVKLLLLVLMAVQVGDLVAWSRAEYVPKVIERVVTEEQIAGLAQMVREADGPVLADEYMGLLPLAGKPIVFQPQEFNRLAQAGLWDDRLLVESIQRQEFPLVLFYVPLDSGRILSQRWSQGIRDAVYENYDQVGRSVFVYVYGRRGNR